MGVWASYEPACESGRVTHLHASLSKLRTCMRVWASYEPVCECGRVTNLHAILSELRTYMRVWASYEPVCEFEWVTNLHASLGEFESFERVVVVRVVRQDISDVVNAVGGDRCERKVRKPRSDHPCVTTTPHNYFSENWPSHTRWCPPPSRPTSPGIDRCPAGSRKPACRSRPWSLCSNPCSGSAGPVNVIMFIITTYSNPALLHRKEELWRYSLHKRVIRCGTVA